MDCTNCPWKYDREACRACRAENANILAVDVPGAQERAESQDWVADVCRKLEDALGVQGWAVEAADAAFMGFLCAAGHDHVHYIRHKVDEIEYTDSLYGLQN